MLDGLEPASIAIVIVEDDRRIREGLRVLLDGTAGFRCVNAWCSMEEALKEHWSQLPDVALIDIGLPGISGIEGLGCCANAILQSRSWCSRSSMTMSRSSMRCAPALLDLLKGTPPARLLESIREVVAGSAPMSPEIARRVLGLFRKVRPPERSDYSLTPHELRILKLLVDGHSYKSAATELGIAFHTVAFHVQNTYQKLQVHSKSEAVVKALRSRLTR